MEQQQPGIANTKEWLDRAVENLEWREKFLDSTVYHLSSHASDHFPILLETRRARDFRTRGPKGFRFEEAWLLLEDCEAIVRDAWNKTSGVLPPLAAAHEKIASCAEELHAWVLLGPTRILKPLKSYRDMWRGLMLVTILKSAKLNC